MGTTDGFELPHQVGTVPVHALLAALRATDRPDVRTAIALELSGRNTPELVPVLLDLLDGLTPARGIPQGAAS